MKSFEGLKWNLSCLFLTTLSHILYSNNIHISIRLSRPSILSRSTREFHRRPSNLSRTVHLIYPPFINTDIHHHMPTTLNKIPTPDIAKIASGQVIVDLKAVVKELIENSLVSSLSFHSNQGCTCLLY